MDSFSPLAKTIETFAHWAVYLSESDLNRPWAWKSYDSEGIRFGFFRVMEELRALAAELWANRAPLPQAVRILAQYDAAYWDLQAALLGLDPASADKTPVEGEWPVQRIYAHMLGGDMGFYVAVQRALDQHRKGCWSTDEITDADYDRYLQTDEAAYKALMEGPLDQLQAAHRAWHLRILTDLGSIHNPELDLPSVYWEAEHFTIRFRLHRFESHLRQHTIQVDKTLAALGLAPAEPARLLRRIYEALAEVESTAIGLPAYGAAQKDSLARKLAELIEELGMSDQG